MGLLDEALVALDQFKRRAGRVATDPWAEFLARSGPEFGGSKPVVDTGLLSVIPAVREQSAAGLLDSPQGQAALGFAGPIKGVGKGSEQLTAEGLNKAVRAKRQEATTGRMVGAPPGVDSEAKVNKLVKAYADRIDEALQNGVPRGYFYEQGTAANRAVTDSPYEANKFAMMQGITSSEAPVATNTGWAIKGMEQDAMGAPISTGKYPNAMKGKAEQVLGGDFSHIGEKTHRYASGLAGDVKGKAPNDRWEIRSLGYNTDTAGPAQHDFMDEVRAKAVALRNKRHPDDRPMEILEGQELNWATQRARDMKISHQEAASDTIQDALKSATVQHSWESRGGQEAGHLQGVPEAMQPALHEDVKKILLDPAGKDRLISAMRGMQRPAFDAPGVFEGNISPGTQSQSLAYITQAHGLDPTSAARINATEAMRAYMLGQDAYAYHGLQGGKAPSGPKTDTINAALGRSITDDEALRMSEALGGDIGLVPSESGFRALRLGDDPKFAKNFMENLGPKLNEILGASPEYTGAARVGDYQRMGWSTPGDATRNLLGSLDNPAAPNLRQLADAPESRALAGQLAELQGRYQQHGPHPKLTPALQAWSQGGLAALEELLKKGLAPSLLGYGLLGGGERQDFQ